MRLTLVCLGVLALCLVSSAVNYGDGQAPAASAEQSIRQAVAAYVDAFNRGDMAALASVWAPDAEYVNESGTVTKGRDSIVGLFKQYATNLKGTKLTLKVTSVRPLKGDIALQDGTSAYAKPDGTIDEGRFTAVWFKNDGKWQLRSVRDLPDDTDAASPTGRLKELQWMVGNWEGGNGAVTVAVRWAVNQAFLHYEYKMKSGDTDMIVVQLVGFDPLSNQIKSWMFDSQGGYGEGLWTRDGNSWTGQTAGVLPSGQTGTAINIIHYIDDDNCTFQVRDREVGGQPIPDAEIKLTRKSAK